MLASPHCVTNQLTGGFDGKAHYSHSLCRGQRTRDLDNDRYKLIERRFPGVIEQLNEDAIPVKMRWICLPSAAVGTAA
jgi:hypothetical protein